MNCFRQSGFITTIGLLVFLNLHVLHAECREIIFSSARDITELSAEELMSTTITSVAEKKERLFQSAAAVYVITQDDIRRS